MTLTFVTVNSGNVAHYERKDCPDTIVRAVQEALQASGTLWDGWSINLHHSSADQAYFELNLNGVRTTRCWVCFTQTAARDVWRRIVEARPPIMLVQEPPKTVPWLAVSIAMEGMRIVLTEPHRLMEAPTLEVAIVWAVESLNRG